jgi:hypothetical protein
MAPRNCAHCGSIVHAHVGGSGLATTAALGLCVECGGLYVDLMMEAMDSSLRQKYPLSPAIECALEPRLALERE